MLDASATKDKRRHGFQLGWGGVVGNTSAARNRDGPNYELTFCFLSISSMRWRLAAREGTLEALFCFSWFAMAAELSDNLLGKRFQRGVLRVS